VNEWSPLDLTAPLQLLIASIAPYCWKLGAFALSVAAVWSATTVVVHVAREGAGPNLHRIGRWVIGLGFALAAPGLMLRASEGLNRLQLREGVSNVRFVTSATVYMLSPLAGSVLLAADEPAVAGKVQALPEEKRSRVARFFNRVKDLTVGAVTKAWRVARDAWGAFREHPFLFGYNSAQWAGAQPLLFWLNLLVAVLMLVLNALLIVYGAVLDLGVVLAAMVLSPLLLPLLLWDRTHDWGARPVSLFLLVALHKLAFIAVTTVARFAVGYFLYAQSLNAVVSLSSDCPPVFRNYEDAMKRLTEAFRTDAGERRLIEDIYRLQVCMTEEQIDRASAAGSDEEADALGLAVARIVNRSYAYHVVLAGIQVLIVVFLVGSAPFLVHLALPRELVHQEAVRAVAALTNVSAGLWGTAVQTTSAGAAAVGTVVGAAVGGPVGAAAAARLGLPEAAGRYAGMAAGARMMGQAAASPVEVVGRLGEELHPKE